MAGGLRLLSIDGARTADVGADNSLQVLLYDGQGNPLCLLDQTAIDRTKQRGLLQMGADYKVARLARSSPDGTMRTGSSPCLFYDSIEGTAVDTNKWIQTVSSFTIDQSVGTGTRYNANSTTSTSTGAIQVSHRYFPFIGRQGLVFRTKVRHTAHVTNNQIESGFGNPSNQANTPVNGATWFKRDTDGAYVPTIYVNSVSVSGTAVLQATILAAIATTDYFYQEIFLEESRATFRLTTQGGIVISEQTLDFGPTIGTFTFTHLSIFHRIYNTASTSPTAVQLFVAQTSVWLTDSNGPDYQASQTQMNYGSLTNPTTYLQNANFANSTAPTSATLSNTSASYTTLGGQWQFAATSTTETDWALFGFQVPTPYAFVCTSVRIASVNTGAIGSGSTQTILQWGLGFNSSAISLATGTPYTYMRKTIGLHTFPLTAAIGQTGGNDVLWQGKETIQPGRFFAVVLKQILGAATASQIIRGVCDINGYFE